MMQAPLSTRNRWQNLRGLGTFEMLIRQQWQLWPHKHAWRQAQQYVQQGADAGLTVKQLQLHSSSANALKAGIEAVGRQANVLSLGAGYVLSMSAGFESITSVSLGDATVQWFDGSASRH